MKNRALRLFIMFVMFIMGIVACTPDPSFFPDDGEGGKDASGNSSTVSVGSGPADQWPSTTDTATVGSGDVATVATVTTGGGGMGGAGGMAGVGGMGSTTVVSTTAASTSVSTSVSTSAVTSSASSTSVSTSAASTSASSSASTSVSASASSSAASGGGMVTGTFTVAVYDPNQTQNHVYEYTDWITSIPTQNAKFFAKNIMLNEGIDYTFNGTVDGTKSWCGRVNGTDMRTVVIAATWNGKALQIWIVPNQSNTGCNFKVHTTSPASCPVNDQDCDGYFTGVNVAQNVKDCDDTNPLHYPSQIESWGDTYDFNCDDHFDPSSWVYRMGGPSGKSSVQLVDGNSWDGSLGVNGDFAKVYTMAWNGSTGYYEASVGSWIAPTNYVERYKQNAGDAWSWDPQHIGNSCPMLFSHQVVDSYSPTVIGFDGPTAASNCHFIKQ
ncbi:MAG: hypothetical protein ABIO72_04860 [Patescibacteria group bacterium]